MLDIKENLKMVKTWLRTINSDSEKSEKAAAELIEFFGYLLEIENDYSYLKNEIKLLNRKIDKFYL